MPGQQWAPAFEVVLSLAPSWRLSSDRALSPWPKLNERGRYNEELEAHRWLERVAGVLFH